MPDLRPAGGRPLLADGVRRRAAALLAACVTVVALLGAWLAHRPLPGLVDRHVDDWLAYHVDRGSGALMAVSSLGDATRVADICAAAVVACALTRRYRGALLLVIAVPLAGASTEYVLKPLLDRTIAGNLAFPSGHITGVSAMAVAAVVLLSGPARSPLPGLARWLLSAAALLTVVVAAVAVVSERFHYFTDTIGGAAVGTSAVLATALVLDAAAPRRRRRRPAAAELATPDGISAVASGMPPV